MLRESNNHKETTPSSEFMSKAGDGSWAWGLYEVEDLLHGRGDNDPVKKLATEHRESAIYTSDRGLTLETIKNSTQQSLQSPSPPNKAIQSVNLHVNQQTAHKRSYFNSQLDHTKGVIRPRKKVHPLCY